jgi:hypothetical protein
MLLYLYQREKAREDSTFLWWIVGVLLVGGVVVLTGFFVVRRVQP